MSTARRLRESQPDDGLAQPIELTLWDKLAVGAIIFGLLGLLILALVGGSALILWLGKILS